MELLIVILILAIVGFVIYQSQPWPKFRNGKRLLELKRYSEAIIILEKIFASIPDAPGFLAQAQYHYSLELKAVDRNKSDELLEDNISCSKKMPIKANQVLFNRWYALVLLEVGNRKYHEILNEPSSDKKLDLLIKNVEFLNTSEKGEVAAKFTDLFLLHLKDISILQYINGLKYEEMEKYADAIIWYRKSIDNAEKCANRIYFLNGSARLAITRLKNNEEVDESLIKNIEKAIIQFKDEYYYRLAVKHFLDKDLKLAEDLINSKFPKRPPAVQILENGIKHRQRELALASISELNQCVDKLNDNSIHLDDLQGLYNTIESQYGTILKAYPDLSNSLFQIRFTVFNRLLGLYFSEGEFIKSVSIIQRFPRFWENPALLKSLAICCYSVVINKKLCAKNYEAVIASWITAVYSDNVILKSIEDTTWDDDYTFTLKESIGSKYAFHSNLPENVNHGDINNNNISIGATQIELLSNFESLLKNNIDDPVLSENAFEFYYKEKVAVEAIVEYIPFDILFAAPSFAISYGFNETILECLEKVYVDKGDENCLVAGLPYLARSSNSFIKEFKEAKNILNGVIVAINNENLKELKSYNNEKNKKLLCAYYSIRDSVEDLIYSAISERISINESNKTLIPIMEECFLIANSNEKLKHQYSDFVSSYCISLVNNNSLDNLGALKLMFKVYNVNSESYHVCRNIITLINFNLLDSINSNVYNSTELFSILDKIILKKSKALRASGEELKRTREDILKSLKDNGNDISMFLDNSPLSDLYLNAAGKKLKNVIFYLKRISD